MSYYLHGTAVLDEGAKVGNGTKIWHWVHICKGASIGELCTVGQNVYIGGGAKIGNGVKIQNNVSVYDGVIIEDDVFCGPSMVFTNVLTPRAFVCRKEEFRRTLVMRGCSIGANATVICGTSLGRYSMVAAGAVVTKDVPDYGLVAGVPAVQIGWVAQDGRVLPFKEGDTEWRDPQNGDTYRVEEGKMIFEQNP